MSDQGYKLLGFITWHAGKWYVRRRVRQAQRELTIAAIAAAVLALLVAGIVAVPRSRSQEQS